MFCYLKKKLEISNKFIYFFRLGSWVQVVHVFWKNKKFWGLIKYVQGVDVCNFSSISVTQTAVVLLGPKLTSATAAYWFVHWLGASHHVDEINFTWIVYISQRLFTQIQLNNCIKLPSNTKLTLTDRPLSSAPLVFGRGKHFDAAICFNYLL